MYAHAQIQSELRTCSTCTPHPHCMLLSELSLHAMATFEQSETLETGMTRDYIHYLSDGLETHTPPYYKVHVSVFAITLTGKKYCER